MAQKIKKGDMVIILSGKNRGQEGKVEQVMPRSNKLIVAGINLVKKHVKPSTQNPNGGIIEKSAPLHISKVAIKDPKTGKPTRVGFKMENGKKLRVAKASGSIL